MKIVSGPYLVINALALAIAVWCRSANLDQVDGDPKITHIKADMISSSSTHHGQAQMTGSDASR